MLRRRNTDAPGVGRLKGFAATAALEAAEAAAAAAAAAADASSTDAATTNNGSNSTAGGPAAVPPPPSTGASVTTAAVTRAATAATAARVVSVSDGVQLVIGKEPSARLDPLLPGSRQTQLCIGDTIVLCVQCDGELRFIGSEGFVDVSGSLRPLDLMRPVPWAYVDCLWQVTQKHMYDAQKAIRNLQKGKSRPAKPGALPSSHETAMSGAAAAALEKTEHKDGARPSRSSVGAIAKLATSAAAASASMTAERLRQQHDEAEAALKAERLSNRSRNDEKRGKCAHRGGGIHADLALLPSSYAVRIYSLLPAHVR